jgi:hypothetical protein
MPRARRYLLPSTDEYITSGKINRLSDNQQEEIIRHWFCQRFDPPDALPYDSSEGGFQWIWGGPYDARSAIYGEFDGVASDTALAATNSALNDISSDWSGKPDDAGYSDDYLSDLLASGDPYMTLIASLMEIESTAKRKRAKTDGLIIHRLLYANIITSLETYLGDSFGKKIASNHQYLENFVLKSGHFQNQTIPLSKIFLRSKSIDSEVLTSIAAHNWHRLTASAKMYKQALNVKFPDTPKTIDDGIADRHDIVHRNGKTHDRVEGSWGLPEILALKQAVLEFATAVEDELKELLLPKHDIVDAPIEI